MKSKKDVEEIPITRIFPSRENPRKRLPHELVAALYDGMEHRAFLQELRSRAETHAGLAEFLKGLDDLSNSIQQVGQLAPIRVLPDEGETYVIEMGERRWLSHLILFFERGEAQYEQIDAMVGMASDKMLQRRMAENIHRAEFSPIEMAKGLAARLDELQREMPTAGLLELEERVGAENGIKARRVRQYLLLLTLDEQTLEMAEQGHLTERALRGVLKFKKPAEQLTAVRRLVGESAKEDRIVKSTAAPKAWAEIFVRNVLTLGKRGKQRAAYARALRVQLKKNPRVHTLLGRVLHSIEYRNGKRAVSQGTGTNNRRFSKRQVSARRGGLTHPENVIARGRGAFPRRARRRGRT